jgi:cation diffusion facilitator CzcD-associated flavoprotein CzcO
MRINSDSIVDGPIRHQENQEVFDVAIIGGGFSGLSAALLLGRYLRQAGKGKLRDLMI